MQSALLSSTGFGVFWAWIQILVPALMSCVNLTKLYDLSKPDVSSKVEIKIIMWSEGWSVPCAKCSAQNAVLPQGSVSVLLAERTQQVNSMARHTVGEAPVGKMKSTQVQRIT